MAVATTNNTAAAPSTVHYHYHRTRHNHRDGSGNSALGMVVVALIVALIAGLGFYYGASLFASRSTAVTVTVPSPTLREHRRQELRPERIVRSDGPSFSSMPAPHPDALDCDAYYIDHGRDPRGHCSPR